MAFISIIPYIISILTGFAIGVGIHCLQAYGLSRMAAACGIRRPWMAWIPVVNSCTVGQLARQNAERQGKKPMAYDKILLILNIFSTLLLVIMYIALGGFLAEMVTGISQEIYSAEFIMNPALPEINAQNMVLFLLGFVAVYLVLLVVSVAYSVFWYIALWQIFKLFDEKNAVLYLVLSIFLNIATPIIFIILGNKRPDMSTPPTGGYAPYGQTSYQPPYNGL